MKKIKLTILIIVMIAMMFILSGCTSSIAETENRFKSFGYLGVGNNGSTMFYDSKTKVIYIFYKSGYSGGLTVLLDAEGKPLLYEGD